MYIFQKQLPLTIIAVVICGLCRCDVGISIPKSPPEPWQAALMARYIVHTSDWVSVATISTQSAIRGYPFVGLKSLSDGPTWNSTGIPYLYMTSMDVTGHDLESNKNVTIMATLGQSDFCRLENYDPQDPRCAKVIITGTFVKIDPSSAEYQFGKKCLFERHPVMETWPADHGFYVSKVNPALIEVLDFFGGIKYVSVEDYFSANITQLINADMKLENVSVVRVDA